MRGFLLLAGAYAVLWVLLLLPGAFVLLRKPPAIRPPDDDPRTEAWIPRLRRELYRRSPAGTVQPSEVPFEERRGAAAREDALRVDGSFTVPEGEVVAVGLVVNGDLRCAAGARLLAPVWVTGSVTLDADAATASVVAGRQLTLGPRAHIEGSAAARGPIRLDSEARIDGPAISRRMVVLEPGTVAGSAIAPLVRGGALPDDVEIVPPLAVRPLPEIRWTSRLDAALSELWPEGRLPELVEALEERTGVRVPASRILERARRLGLYSKGIPRRPGMLGRRPAWVLTPEVIRVGADLRIPESEEVGYDLVVEGSLEVFHDACLEGSVHTGRGLLVHSGAVVRGSAVSDGLIVCEEGSAVLGPVASSVHILLFAHSRLGVPGGPGVNARGAIGLEPGARILGPAVAGLGVRGEPLREEALREGPDDEEPARQKRFRRGLRRSRAGRADAPSEATEDPPHGDAPSEATEDPPDGSADPARSTS